MTKKNGNIYKITGIIIGIGLAVAGWIWNAAVLSSDVKINCRDIAAISAVEEVQDKNIDENEDAIIGIKKDLTFILDRQDLMRTEQKETAKEIMRKLDELRNNQ